MENFLEQKTKLVKKSQLLPNSTGVYFYKNEKGRIIYIGKAINIKKRIKSYFYAKDDNTDRMLELLKNIWDLDWIITLSEQEALVLEDQMIKKHKPKYNVLLKDDKSYPYIKITSSELFPRMMLTREHHKKEAHYFGPYTSVKNAKITIETLRKQFPLRTSKMDLDGTKIYKPCINFQMGRCLAPCNGEVDSDKYRKIVLQIIRILKGNTKNLIKELRIEMGQKAQLQEFEQAASYRDKIFAIEKTIKRHWVVSKERVHRDIIAILRKETSAGIQVLFIRAGILFGSDFFFIPNAQLYSNEELFRTSFSKIYLGKTSIIPTEIVLSANCENFALEKYFAQKNQKIKIIIPQKGEKKQLVKMALKNAEKNFELYFENNTSQQNLLQKMKKVLHLQSVPQKIECFDISNIQSSHIVASMVVMENNQLLKKEYRKFKIRSSKTGDITSMLEVLTRRWQQWQENKNELPDLTLVDGGKAQLNAAYKLAQKMNLPLHRMDLLAIAKGKSMKKKTANQPDRSLEFDYLLKAGKKDPYSLKNYTEILRPFQRIRDEAHRFAISFHRKLRDKETLASPLMAIAKIGEIKRKNLIIHFKNIENIRNSTITELQKAPKISLQDAQNIYDYFQKN